jgi:hypothetical protein
MTVGELRKLLAGVPDDFQVIMSKDSCGNYYRPFYRATSGVIDADPRWIGPREEFWLPGEPEPTANAVVFYPG